jgi:Uma2 family endonuclease
MKGFDAIARFLPKGTLESLDGEIKKVKDAWDEWRKADDAEHKVIIEVLSKIADRLDGIEKKLEEKGNNGSN